MQIDHLGNRREYISKNRFKLVIFACILRSSLHFREKFLTSEQAALITNQQLGLIDGFEKIFYRHSTLINYVFGEAAVIKVQQNLPQIENNRPWFLYQSSLRPSSARLR